MISIGRYYNNNRRSLTFCITVHALILCHEYFKNLKSANQTKVINRITIHFHARPCYIVSP